MFWLASRPRIFYAISYLCQSNEVKSSSRAELCFHFRFEKSGNRWMLLLRSSRNVEVWSWIVYVATLSLGCEFLRNFVLLLAWWNKIETGSKTLFSFSFWEKIEIFEYIVNSSPWRGIEAFSKFNWSYEYFCLRERASFCRIHVHLHRSSSSSISSEEMPRHWANAIPVYRFFPYATYCRIFFIPIRIY